MLLSHSTHNNKHIKANTIKKKNNIQLPAGMLAESKGSGLLAPGTPFGSIK